MSLETVWVVAQYINDPKPTNPKNGSIKDPTLGYISVPVAALSQFTKGKRYCIYIEKTDRGFLNFKGFANPAPGPAAPAQTFDGRQPQQTTRPIQPQPIAQTLPRGRRIDIPMNGNGLEDPTALNIFCTGIVGRALGSGHFVAKDIDELMKEAKAAFLKYLAPQRPTSAPEPEFNDPLPDPSQYGAQGPDDDQIPY